MAVVLVLVLSLPRVAFASDQEEIITYECVEGNYGAGTVEKMMTCTAFQIPNSMYEYVTNLMQDCPVDYKSYDYYLVTLAPNSPIIRVFCFNSPSAICVTYPVEYEDGVSEDSDYSQKDYNLLVSSYEAVVSNVSTASDYDDLYGQSQYIYLTEGTGTYLTRSGASSSWSISYKDDTFSYSADSKSYLTLSGAIIDTNLPVYHGYEMNKNGWYSNKTINKAFEVASTCTNLNLSNRRYNGSGYVGGAASYAYDLTFDEFLVEKINHPDFLGGSGAYITYSMGQKLFDEVYANPEWKLQLDFEISYSLSVTYDGLLKQEVLGGQKVLESGIVYYSQLLELDSYVVQDGKYLFDVGTVVYEDIENSNPVFAETLSQMMDENYTFDDVLDASLIDCIINWSELFGTDDDKYAFDFIDIKVTGKMVNEENNIVSNSGFRTLELLTGKNSGYVNQYDSETESSVPGESTSNGNFYDVAIETDSGGNTYYNYYYYDTTNNTVTPSINTGSNELTLYFATPLTIEGVSSSGGGSSSSSSNATVGGSGDNINITIEDDDYTDTALREDLADGFGLFDDSETELKADGYLQMAAGFFNNIDSGLGAIIVFGISSSVVIGILRTALRR